jgi:ATP-dependent helicase/nuclease subunit A
MSDDLTDQQRRPLEVEGASVALSAGAGCGKTTVLTARFLGDLDGPDARPLGSIVAMTFTEKAARELRQRIRSKCRARLAAGADSHRWRAVLRALEAAPIGTFHEFCGHWLRRHADRAGIDPDFAILDATIAGTVRDEALDRCIRQWLAKLDPELIDLAVEYGLSRVRDALGDLVAERAAGRLDDWVGRTPEEVVALWREAWETQGRAAMARKLEASARACLELLRANDCTHPKMCERRAFLLAELPELAGRSNSDEWLESIREQAKVQGGGTAAHWPAPEVYEAVKEGFEQLRKAITDFREKAKWDEAATLEAAGNGLKLARLASKVRQDYDRAKRTRGALDFDDLLVKVRNLLRDHPEAVADLPGGALHRVLVDEFQDTDPIQGEILRHLAGEALGDGRLFLVGDYKQSIYRFRGARPKIFEEFRTDFPANGRHALTENFRSVPGILDFVNALFADTFPGAENALDPGPKTPPRDDRAAVEFLWASEAPADDPATSRRAAHDRRTIEARWLARRLRQRIDAGWPVRDRKTGKPRDAHAGDVAFLFRAMTDVGPYESTLLAEGFDYHVVGGSGFYLQQEVQDLVNVLSAIEDPLDAVALAGALRSPFFCLSDDGLFWLATRRRAELIDALAVADQIAELSDDDRRQACRARDLLQRWRGLKDRLPIASLVNQVLDESGYEAALLGEFLGPRKRANARKLVRLARRFDRQGDFTLGAFVARLRADLRRPPREEQAATTDEAGKSIRLMSIHQAKGLEFPIVVIPDLNRKPPSLTEFVAFQPELGPLVRPSADGGADLDDPDADDSRRSLGWLTYQAIEQAEEENEALRLFYVAATRARDALILSAGIGTGDKANSPALRLLDDRFDRATGRCRVSLPVNRPAPVIRVTTESPAPSSSFVPTRRWQPPLIETADAIARETVGPDPGSMLSPGRPRLVDLDPAQGLVSTLARLDRLVRAILDDPSTFPAKDWRHAAAKAAQRLDPLAPRRLIDQAIARLEPWLDGPIGRELAAASSIERSLPWTLAWPPDGGNSTIFQGRIDLVFRDSKRFAQVLCFSDSTASEPRERLRLLLSARAADAFGLGPVCRGWQIRLGLGGSLRGEELFDAIAIEESLENYFERESSVHPLH